MTVLVSEQHQLPLVAAQMVIRTGSAFDPAGKEGLAALTAALLTKGAGARAAVEIADMVDFQGSTLDVDHSHEATFLSASMLSRDTEVMLELIADIAIRPVFAEEEVARARENLLASIAQTHESANYLASVFFNRFLYGSHPYSRPELGLASSVARLTRQDITGFHQTFYVPNNAFLVIAGDVRKEAVMKTVRRLFQGWQKQALPGIVFPAPPALNAFSIHVVDKPDISQAHVRMGTLAIPRRHPDYLPLLVASTILGGGFSSRLVTHIRVDRGLTYGIDSRFTLRQERGAFVVSTFTKTETAGEMVDAVMEELRRFRTPDVTAADVRAARQYLAGVFPLTLEGPRALTGQIANMELFGLPVDYLQTYRVRVQAVAVEDVIRVIRQHIPDSALLCVLLGNADEIVPQVEHLGPVQRHAVE